MNIERKLKDGSPVLIKAPVETEVRLRDTCFRGQNVHKAGNFIRWTSIRDMLRNDHFVYRNLLAEIDAAWTTTGAGTYSFTISHSAMIGWETTQPLENFKPEDLRVFRLARRGHAMAVKPERTELLAPQTKEVTFVYQLKHDDQMKGRLLVLIRSLYPGKDVGALRGDVSQRTQRAFFDFNHPGEA